CDRRGVHCLAKGDGQRGGRRLGLYLQMEHGMDERCPVLPGKGSHLPEISSPQSDLWHDLCLLGAVYPGAVPRRGGSWKGQHADEAAGNHGGKVPGPSGSLWILFGASWEKALVYGAGICPDKG